MNNPVARLATILVATLLTAGAARANPAEPGAIILPPDPRFNVFELANSAGDGSYASSVGTPLLSFLSKDQRYCRTVRFPADKNVVLACRAEQGWEVVAVSSLTPSEAAYPTNFGGGNMQEVSDAALAMMAGIKPMDELEIIEAASKGWRNPAPIDERAYDAGDILGKTALVYRTSKSYVDTGIAKTINSNETREWTGETHFKTAYVAPFDFRFESSMRDIPGAEIHYIAWRDEEDVSVWYNLDPEIDDRTSSIQDALDNGAGISRDASGMIPGLIFPGTKLGGDIVRLTSAARLDDAEIDGFDCFQVQGFRWPNTGSPTTVWIDKESFVIHRVYEEQEIKGVMMRTTWYYDAAINVPVDEQALRFDKPAP